VAPLLILSLFDDVVLRLGGNGEIGASLHVDRAPGNWTGTGCGARAALPIPRLPSALL
jgi:hypothetical protein